MANFIVLDSAYIQLMVAFLDNESTAELMKRNNWYAEFISSIRFELIRRRRISKRQLDQLRKIAVLTNQKWNICI